MHREFEGERRFGSTLSVYAAKGSFSSKRLAKERGVQTVWDQMKSLARVLACLSHCDCGTTFIGNMDRSCFAECIHKVSSCYFSSYFVTRCFCVAGSLNFRVFRHAWESASQCVSLSLGGFMLAYWEARWQIGEFPKFCERWKCR